MIYYDIQEKLNKTIAKVALTAYGIGFVAGAITAIGVRTLIMGSI